MKELREDIRIFQDAKDNKTTIVCWNLSKKTKEKLISILLDDIQTVETVSGMTNTPPDYGKEVKNTQNMQEVLNPAVEARLAGKAVADQIDILADEYEKTKSHACGQSILFLLPQVYDSNENTKRQVLYALRNMSPAVADYASRISGRIMQEVPESERDLIYQKVLMESPAETLTDLLHQLTPAR